MSIREPTLWTANCLDDDSEGIGGGGWGVDDGDQVVHQDVFKACDFIEGRQQEQLQADIESSKIWICVYMLISFDDKLQKWQND